MFRLVFAKPFWPIEVSEHEAESGHSFVGPWRWATTGMQPPQFLCIARGHGATPYTRPNGHARGGRYRNYMAQCHHVALCPLHLLLHSWCTSSPTPPPPTNKGPCRLKGELKIKPNFPPTPQSGPQDLATEQQQKQNLANMRASLEIIYNKKDKKEHKCYYH